MRAYQIDTDLGAQAKCFQENIAQIDVDWWSRIFAMKMPEGGMRFPILGKLVKALLSLFTGPLVKRSFNIMDDIIEKDRVRLNIETYEGLAIIKSHMNGLNGQNCLQNINYPCIEEIVPVLLCDIPKSSEEKEREH